MHTTLTTRSLAAAGAAALSAALLLSGCSSTANTSAGVSVSATGGTPVSAAGATTGSAGLSAGASASGTPGGGSATTPGGSPSGSGAVIVVHNADKGHTVTLHPGQTLAVQLTGGYWSAPKTSAALVLRLSRQPSFLSPSPGQGCPPGVGCRAQETRFMAMTPGTATVSSSRTQCGEAMRCTDASGQFSITVKVTSS